MRKKIIILTVGLFLTFLASASRVSAADMDLTIDSVSFSPVQPIVGQTAKIIIKGKYTGDSALTMNLGVDNVAFSHNDFKQESTTETGASVKPSEAYPLSSGSYFNYTLVGKFTAGGLKSLVFKIDGVNNLVESNEDNNLFTQAVNVLADGDLIKLANSSAVYLIKVDGKKHLFVNSPTFWSYYTGSWSSIKLNGRLIYIQEVSQSAFDAITTGQNVAVKSGARLIKFENSPKIYAVFGEAKLKYMTDQKYLELYGSRWKDQAITIQNGFEADYIRADQDFIDADNDGLANNDEQDIYKTDLYLADSDGDGYKDGLEVINGYNPNLDE
ncbi:MAG: hypothetical protein A2820_03665 [Candidatus Buchananbacteria bacterium RIFCSPHIGHO2_01_FULL_40_35]|nr:MAG: hypothetical protein A2820_03665 [Candidatus Buchananbacteria bacterium RIFCSPHIGHO2_01_FULL_40_35]